MILYEGAYTMNKLMCMLKVIYENIWMIHHNLVGENWFGSHELFGDFYDEIQKMADDVIEIGIALGNVEPDIKEAVEQYPVIPSGSIIDNETAFKFCYNFFEDLIKEFESTKDIVPGDVYSKFEEYIYWLRLTAEYKIKHRLYNNVEK